MQDAEAKMRIAGRLGKMIAARLGKMVIAGG